MALRPACDAELWRGRRRPVWTLWKQNRFPTGEVLGGGSPVIAVWVRPGYTLTMHSDLLRLDLGSEALAADWRSVTTTSTFLFFFFFSPFLSVSLSLSLAKYQSFAFTELCLTYSSIPRFGLFDWKRVKRRVVLWPAWKVRICMFAWDVASHEFEVI